MNDHADYEELLALRLYDELDETERGRLAIHLGNCARCRARAAELESGLGRLRAASAEQGFTPDARARLADALGREPRRQAKPVAAALLGFAAGVLCALGLGLVLVARGGDAPPQGEFAAGTTAVFARATPPPATLDRGLGELLTARRR